MFGDHLVAAPGLQGDLLHHLGRPVALRGEFEAPMNRGAIAVDEDRTESRGFDLGDGGKYRRLARGQHVAAPARLVMILARRSIRRVEALDGPYMVVGFHGGGEGFDDMTVRHGQLHISTDCGNME
jgi:hypothetical protein